MKGTIWISLYLRVKVSWKTVKHKKRITQKRKLRTGTFENRFLMAFRFKSHGLIYQMWLPRLSFYCPVTPTLKKKFVIFLPCSHLNKANITAVILFPRALFPVSLFSSDLSNWSLFSFKTTWPRCPCHTLLTRFSFKTTWSRWTWQAFLTLCTISTVTAW